LVTSFYGYDSGRLAELYKPYYRELIEKGELFLALSQDMKEDLLRIGFPDKKVRVHRLGIDLSSFHPKSTINNEKFTILTVARLDKVKGIQHVMDAIACIIRQYPQLRDKLRYKVIGGGGYELYLKKYAEKIGLSDIVVFKNNLIVSNSREIVLKEMQNCDVFCLCSYTPKNRAKEGTPVVLMEVQACGKPCISTYHAGIPEVVINNKTGILVKEKSVKDIVSAIEMFYFDPRYRLKMGINARRHIQEEFNHSIQMSKLTELYDNIYFNQK
jgi:colanic acid/amylovoran biosynthesis glycosyltransferase